MIRHHQQAPKGTEALLDRASMGRMILSNARVITPVRDFYGSLVIEDGRIAEIVDGKAYGNGEDLHGLWLCPGLVDLHSDYFEREINPRPNTSFPLPMALQFVDLRAASAGITSLFNAISFRESELENRTIDRALTMSYELDKEASLGHFLIHHYLQARLEMTEERIVEVIDKIAHLKILKEVVYNEHVPGRRQLRDIDAFTKYVASYMGNGMEDIAATLAKRIDRAAMGGALRRLAYERLCALPNVDQILIGSHDDYSIDDVVEAMSAGAKLFEFPTSLEAARYVRSSGMTILMGAPNLVLGSSQSGNVSCREAIQEGLVDILCSDYHFPAMLLSVVILIEKGWSPSNAVNLVTLNPACIAKLDSELGSIEVGKKADLVIFDTVNNLPRVHRVYVEGELRLHMGYAANESSA